MARLVVDARESGTSTGRYVDKLIEYLHQLEPVFEVTVLTKRPRIGFMKDIAPNFEIKESNFKEFTFAEQLGFLSQLNKLDADLVHFSMTQQPVLYGGRRVTTVHDLTTARFNNPSKNWLVYKFKQLVYRWVIKRAAKISNQVIVPSQFVKDDLAGFARIKPDKVTVTYEAADVITDKSQAIEKLQDKEFIMYVGRPTPHKNLEKLIDAFAIILNNEPDLILALAGKTDKNYERIKKLVAEKGLSGSVIFTGYMNDAQLRWMYENTAAYVFPSLSEGFGLPGLEAMAHGAPVASSNATCLPEIYGEAAHYFDPTDEQDMALKIFKVISDPKLREGLIKKGYEQVKKYSWASMAEETLEVYKKALH
jgi:glycosyltransferase involved in cell wall biosynthesis